MFCALSHQILRIVRFWQYAFTLFHLKCARFSYLRFVCFRFDKRTTDVLCTDSRCTERTASTTRRIALSHDTKQPTYRLGTKVCMEMKPRTLWQHCAPPPSSCHKLPKMHPAPTSAEEPDTPRHGCPVLSISCRARKSREHPAKSDNRLSIVSLSVNGKI